MIVRATFDKRTYKFNDIVSIYRLFHFRLWIQDALCPRVNECNGIDNYISCEECIDSLSK